MQIRFIILISFMGKNWKQWKDLMTKASTQVKNIQNMDIQKQVKKTVSNLNEQAGKSAQDIKKIAQEKLSQQKNSLKNYTEEISKKVSQSVEEKVKSIGEKKQEVVNKISTDFDDLFKKYDPRSSSAQNKNQEYKEKKKISSQEADKKNQIPQKQQKIQQINEKEAKKQGYSAYLNTNYFSKWGKANIVNQLSKSVLEQAKKLQQIEIKKRLPSEAIKNTILQVFSKLYLKLVGLFVLGMFFYGLGSSVPKQMRIFIQNYMDREKKNEKQKATLEKQDEAASD